MADGQRVDSLLKGKLNSEATAVTFLRKVKLQAGRCCYYGKNAVPR